ncbi:MAG TPA: redoxin family protein, partial [Candidatus Aquilonibacter sp.]
MRRAIARLAAAALVFCGLLGLGRDAALPSFDGNAGWINSAPLTAADLKGKVVLVDFWEYTCINCLRTLPYLKAWYRRYHDDGLVIVGVHTPEFPFSQERKNVAAATQRLGVTWPVVLDNGYAIWHRFDNDVWPHEYLFDQSGRLVEGVSGEGFYQTTETEIQKLLHAQNP